MLSAVIEKLSSRLLETHRLLVTAESCTGGLLAAYLTEVPGSSHWFERGFVTYSKEAKQELLDVPTHVLAQYGVISEEVARAMAVGALKHAHAHLAVSITGIAGPAGGSKAQPVGTICFGWASKAGEVRSLTCHFKGDRQQIRQQACEKALEGLLSF